MMSKVKVRHPAILLINEGFWFMNVLMHKGWISSSEMSHELSPKLVIPCRCQDGWVFVDPKAITKKNRKRLERINKLSLFEGNNE
jgi:hypothetical protein